MSTTRATMNGQVVEASSTDGEFVVVNLEPAEGNPKYGSVCDDVELGPIKHHVSNSSKDDAAEGETVCRVCHLGLSSGNSESIVLGCACKQDLALCHKDCAEEWFKIRGNTVCEICGETAKNVQILDLPATVGRLEAAPAGGAAEATLQQVRGASSTMSRLRYLWANQLIRNCLLATMIIVFMVPWFFRIAYF